MANEKTQQANEQTVKYHIARMAPKSPSAKNIADYLVEYAKTGKISKRSWHKLRFQFLEQQNRNGFDTKFLDWEAMKSRVDGVEFKKIKKNNRKIMSASASKSYKEALASNFPDGVGWAYWVVCEATGCRPSEVFDIDATADGHCSVYGRKKNKAHKSGLDRVLKIKDPVKAAEVVKALELLKSSGYEPAQAMARAQQSIIKVASSVDAPKFSLRSLRHMKATEMKRAGWSPVQIASVLGHQATKTQEHYGRTYGNSEVEPGLEIVLTSKTIRENHNTNPNPYAKDSLKVVESVSNEAVDAVLERLEKPNPSSPTARPSSTVQSRRR